jgi:hypothetical protein
MPIRGSPDGARHPRPQLVAIARNEWSRPVGTISRCAQSTTHSN